MNNIYDKKQNKINEIVSIVKLSSLLFSAMVFINYNLMHFSITVDDYENMLMICSICIVILAFVYFLWVFSTRKKFCKKYSDIIQSIENFIFVSIFFTTVLFTGTNKSQYKFLFLFIIITTTIQCGMKHGMIIASISSFIILTMDLVCALQSTVNSYFQNDLIIAGVFMLTAWPLGFYVKTESEHIKRLENLVNEDGLTGVYNHRFFYDTLEEMLLSSEADNKPVSLIFVDIDYFRHYNDLYGHQKGDEVLKIFGSILKSSVREGDILARYSGEQFAIILPNTNEKEALKIAEIIRRAIEKTHFQGEENQPNGKLTASIGLSVYPDKAKNDIDLINSADDALFRAKFFDKNRVEIYNSVLDQLKEDIEEKHIDLITSVKTLIGIINAKDRYTYGHIERVVIYSRLLADKLGLDGEDKKKLIYGAYMHDIGKINIIEGILNKKMPLTEEESEILKHHPIDGVEIIKPVESLKDICILILHHHERYDGKGYPGNLKGEEIPYLARVLTVVDSFDAMTSNRPYSNRKTHDEAMEELKKCSGTQFDPYIVNAFIEVMEENKDSVNY